MSSNQKSEIPGLFPASPVSHLWHSSMKSRSESRPELFLALSMAWKASSAVPNSAAMNNLGGPQPVR